MARPTQEQIEEQINAASESIDTHGTRGQWPGQSFEDGVRAALSWVIGDEETAPMED